MSSTNDYDDDDCATVEHFVHPDNQHLWRANAQQHTKGINGPVSKEQSREIIFLNPLPPCESAKVKIKNNLNALIEPYKNIKHKSQW